MSLTRVHLRQDGQTLVAGLLAPRVLQRGPTCLEVALVATNATLLGGDHVRIELAVDAGMHLVIRDVAGTVAYHSRGREAWWDNEIDVAEGASLVWRAEPLVLSQGASVRRTTHATVAEGGRLLMRDTLVLGRSGETGGDIVCDTELTYAGRPALVERLDLADATLPGMLGAHRVIDTVTLLGARPAATTRAFRLAQPGAVARAVGIRAHDTALDATFEEWATQIGAQSWRG
ncbi:urease accessory protein UreD [Calidifontibacter sp. DB0510]|uniref:Urease accessory protein UreD n=1 Tax=Metallococcus carri TaxID=1656884 RepID=A0A967E8I4_9MICO|nr:urease accessory protein UreD [Metallococcus carri]NHN55247.1 urease accessory protein UreD [Metallococcus carri]NOP36324.1 urease accessory protein [Calidifontibacter sp. DB2511S]